ncbi:hypothetical protein PISMIDRAFT_233929 [Pisolithus microcarpus 441]|uniref:Uncharacterized protein n=1 Tax=Pisolithus microcarpus 441 TaxID=765257 RepID=A0A0C9XXE3_9AGAM|nr:hypothetical protein PISMIDRAFT_233929 [Pisolithus microcarpus 441]
MAASTQTPFTIGPGRIARCIGQDVSAPVLPPPLVANTIARWKCHTFLIYDKHDVGKASREMSVLPSKVLVATVTVGSRKDTSRADEKALSSQSDMRYRARTRTMTQLVGRGNERRYSSSRNGLTGLSWSARHC